MGLDMYAWRVKPEHALGDFEVARTEDDMGSEVDELFYWRKHHDLHGWMEALYRSKGGTEEFNCVKVRLTKEDLDRLVSDLAHNRLPQTKGFFFGDNPPDYASMANDMKFIALAMEAIQAGDAVYYDSWW